MIQFWATVTKNRRVSLQRHPNILLAHDTKEHLGKDVRKGQSGKLLLTVNGDCVKVKLHNCYVITAWLLN